MENDMPARGAQSNPSVGTTTIIVGPTASGKTALSLLLARRMNAEIVSADSRQIYRHLTIGTAKPSDSDRSKVPHHFIDILDPNQEYSAGEYGVQARGVLEEIQKRGKSALVVGGSGLYVKALVDGFFDGPGKDPEVRERLERDLEREGISGLLKKLEHVDPATAQAMAREPKARRVMRALEVYYSTGKPLSVHFSEQKRNPLSNFIMVAPLWERALLYKHIDERVVGMMKQGLLDEVRWLKSHGYHANLNALNTVGYKELFEHLEKKTSLDEAVSLIKLNTRRFAKRQMTWFRADKRIRWLPVSSDRDFEETASSILALPV